MVRVTLERELIQEHSEPESEILLLSTPAAAAVHDNQSHDTSPCSPHGGPQCEEGGGEREGCGDDNKNINFDKSKIGNSELTFVIFVIHTKRVCPVASEGRGFGWRSPLIHKDSLSLNKKLLEGLEGIEYDDYHVYHSYEDDSDW